MHISKIIIDGFKSYASRTVLSGFDCSFNAITGLNGSGKSNILDAICFVLGISNLSQVRVSNLQELVFKRGQAGVTKASVTITFDNSDRKVSPVGYEDCPEITVGRQVVIGGRNKYLINGKNAPLNRVQNLFLSVQLNVNNPHFLIMQGRITKVLNMKPQEILGMIEEAAGTRMYEMKKVSAQKTILKKDKKLEEIGRVLDEEIIPTLEKLKLERAKYIQWSQGKTDIEKLERYCVAYQYSSCLKQSVKARDDVDVMQRNLDELQSKAADCQKAQKKIQKLIEQKKKEKQKEIESEFASLEKKVAELSKLLVKLNSEYQHKKELFESELAKSEKLERQILDEKQSLESNRLKLNSFDGILQTYSERANNCNQKVTNLNKQYEAVYAGLAVSDDVSSGRTLTEQLMDSKTKASLLRTEQEQTILKLNHLKVSLQQKKQTLCKMGEGDEQMKHQLDNMNSKVQLLEGRMKSHLFNPKEHEKRVKRLDQLQANLRDLTVHIDEAKSELAAFFFNYDQRVIEASSIKGTLANLFKIKQPEKSGIALEVTAGGKLFQIVVDTEQTAKNLIKNGRLDRRVTVIPLNKVRYATIPDEVLKKARSMGADPALILIEYDENVDPAMKYAFGQTLVCDSLENAKKVAFDPTINCRTVTYEGDSFDPRGTLTGGSRKTDAANSPLLKLNKLHEKQQECSKIQQEIDSLQEYITKQQSLKKEYWEVKKQIDLTKHEVQLLQKNIEQSRSSQLQKELALTETQITESELKIKTLEEQQSTNDAQITDIEEQLEQFKNTEQSRDSKLKQIEQLSRDAKKQQQQARQELQDKESERERLAALIDEQEEEINELETQYEELNSRVNTDLKQEMEDAKKDALQKKEEYDRSNNILLQRQRDLSRADQELTELGKEKKVHEQNLREIDLELKELQHKMTRLQKTQKDADSIIQNLIKLHTWISSEEHLFGRANSEYDFGSSRESVDEVRQRLESMKSEHQKLSKTVNKKVMSMYEKAEQDYLDLMKKRGIVDKDKSKIEQVIQELDEKKKQAIQKTWTKVNRDFGSIFSTLLPGTTSKLEPPTENDGDVMEGLEVKVAFGNVWKQSLSELSGGQRSLLALSLILALLLFKPAPMYILDEIDAALDPSHTQNIGRMLKTHFANSQFIVVSLKEGMFQNANVLFKTKFVNGQSNVQRITGHKSAVDVSTTSASRDSNQTSNSSVISDQTDDEQSIMDTEEHQDQISPPRLLLSPTRVQRNRQRTAATRGRKRPREEQNDDDY